MTARSGWSRLDPLLSATRVVATLGPASEYPSVLRRMMEAGAMVFRFNLSHGTVEQHIANIAKVRRVASESGRLAGVLVDLPGPKIRTAANEGGGRIPLPSGGVVRVGARGRYSTSERIVIRFPRIARTLGKDDTILLDDGSLVLRILRKVAGDELEATVVRGGMLKERAGVNLPGRNLGLRVPTAKDVEYARMAVQQRADFVALSFVQRAEELVRLRKILETEADRHRDRVAPAVVAKIEKPAALERLDEILLVTHGVMVARGDLGVETALEKVPAWQKQILRRASRAGVFTITATQMLESMVTSEVPTRAEVSDVANAVFDGTDALMLSAESAVGKHPVESVQMLTRIAREVEGGLPVRASSVGVTAPVDGLPATTRAWTNGDPAESAAIEAMVEATLALAIRSGASCIACFTWSGRTGFLLARHHPRIGIVCLTPSEETRRRLTLAWNVRSLLLPRVRTADELMRRGLALLKSAKVVGPGDTVVLVGGAANLPEATNLLRWVRI